MMSKRTSRGRQKIEIKLITNEEARQVTFTKRKQGLFKKASELSILCGAETVVVVFSPAGKVFSFGHPGVDSVVDRFQNRNEPQVTPGSADNFLARHHKALVRDLTNQCTDLDGQVDMAKKRKGQIDQQARTMRSAQYWWSGNVDEINSYQLEQYRVMLDLLKRKIATRTDELKGVTRITTNPGLGQIPHVQTNSVQEQNQVREAPNLQILPTLEELNLVKSFNQVALNPAQPGTTLNGGLGPNLQMNTTRGLEQVPNEEMNDGLGNVYDRNIAGPAPNPTPSVPAYGNLVGGLWFYG